MQSLDALIGKTILVSIQDSEQPFYEVKLHAVEAGGIWIEGQAVTKLLGKLPRSRKGPPEIPIIFVPFSRVEFVVSSSVDFGETSSGRQ